MTKVSVIVPVYGVEKYIERCARSLFEQTLDDIEFIFVNDCTKDNSIEVLQQVILDYPARKSQIKILKHEVNKGLPEARKTGILAAKGEYIAHCDSDDWVDKELYEKLYNFSLMQKADIVLCGIKIVNSIRENIYVQPKVKTGMQLIEKILKAETVWPIWNKLVKKDLYNGIVFPYFGMGEDLVFSFQLALKTNKVECLFDYYYYYYYNDNSITKNRTIENITKNFNQMKINLELVMNIAAQNNISKSQFLLLQNKERNLLIPAIRNKESFFSWFSAFDNINLKVMCSPYISLKEKVRVLWVILKKIWVIAK